MKFNIELITETLNKKNKIAGVITVFINGVATEVGRGAVDMKAMFGGDYVLLHSSGVAVEVNDEHGFLVQSLQHGESYFLVIHFSFNSFYKLIKIPPPLPSIRSVFLCIDIWVANKRHPQLQLFSCECALNSIIMHRHSPYIYKFYFP